MARERLVAAMVASGQAAEAALEAEALTRDQPFREEAWRLLALALYAGGRQSDALDSLRRARNHLVDELGLDPGPALRALELDILSHRVDLPDRSAPAGPMSTEIRSAGAWRWTFPARSQHWGLA